MATVMLEEAVSVEVRRMAAFPLPGDVRYGLRLTVNLTSGPTVSDPKVSRYSCVEISGYHLEGIKRGLSSAR